MSSCARKWIQGMGLGSAQYVKEYLRILEEYLSKKGEALSARAQTQLLITYRTYIDISEELRTQESLYYQ